MKLARWVACGVVAYGALGVVALAQGNGATGAAVGATAATGADAVSVVDYTYEDPEKGFTMQVPADWKVQRDFGGYAIFMEPSVKAQPTAENPVVADPNITVAVLRSPVHVDERGLGEYEKEMKAKFIETNGAGSELNVFSKNVMDLPGGKKGLLYYLTYKKNGYDVVSAVLVMSNDKAMYRLTLTDYKVGFDKNLERYFPVMATLQVKGEPLARIEPWRAALPFAGIGGAIIVLIGGAFFVRNRRMKAILASSPAAHRKKSVEDLEGSLLRGETRKKGKSRPPKESASPSVAAGSAYGDASSASASASSASASASGFGASSPDSLVPMSLAAGSSYGSGAPASMAFGSTYGSAAPDSAASSGGKPAKGDKILKGTKGRSRDPDEAPLSEAFPVSHFETGAKAPLSQPLSVAFGGAKPSDAPKGFQGTSEAPRSNKPLPGGRKNPSKETKAVAGASDSIAPGSSATGSAAAGSVFPVSTFEDDDK